MASILDHVNLPWVLPVVRYTYILCRTSGRVDDACCAGSRFRRLVEGVSERVLLPSMQQASMTDPVPVPSYSLTLGSAESPCRARQGTVSPCQEVSPSLRLGSGVPSPSRIMLTVI